MTTRHRFAPGNATAIVTESGVALVDLPVGSGAVAVFDRFLNGELPVESLVTDLLAGGIDRLPSFCVADLRGERVRLLVRGRAIVDVARPGQAAKVDGGDVTLWREDFVVRPAHLTLTIGAVELGSGYWVTTGVIPASAVYLDLGHTISAELPEGEPADHEPAMESEAPSQSPTSAGPVPVSVPAIPADVTEVVDAVPTDAPAGASPRPEPAVPAPAGDAGPSDLIDGLPEWLRTGSAPASPTETASDAGLTTYRASAASEQTADDGGVKTVARQARPLAGPGGLSGVRCPGGHANPPGTERCRGCGQAIVDLSPVQVAPAEVGVLRFSDGREVHLARPVVIGREPPSDPVEGKTPSRVVVDDQQLSRRHASVWADGWSVFVVDHESTNDTTLSLPGSGVTTLVPHQHTELTVGAVVDLGGVLTFRLDAV